MKKGRQKGTKKRYKTAIKNSLHKEEDNKKGTTKKQ